LSGCGGLNASAGDATSRSPPVPVSVVDRPDGARYAALKMTTELSTGAVTRPRGGWRGRLARLGMATQVLIVGAIGIAGVPFFGLMIAGAVNEQLLASTGTRAQAVVIDHGEQQVTVAFDLPAGQRVQAPVGLWEDERPGAYPVESTVGVVYDPDHPRTVDLEARLRGIGSLIDRVVSAGMGLLFLLFSIGLIVLGGREAASTLTAWRSRARTRAGAPSR
jgi:hypothetical protein